MGSCIELKQEIAQGKFTLFTDAGTTKIFGSFFQNL